MLALSFGPGSTALLHLLSQHLKGQFAKTGRTGYKLHVLHVRMSGDDEGTESLERVKTRYPDHEYCTASLAEALDCDGIRSILPEIPQSEDHDNLMTILRRLGSTTAQADVMQLLLCRLVAATASRTGCEGILWGNSTTRLAERTLANAANGRGASLPFVTADGMSLYKVPFFNPMRDLLSKEIASFISIVEPSLDELVVQHEQKPMTSTKYTTIDDLMRQYFEHVEQNYPSIVANVVRTSDKLQAPSLTDVETQCELCCTPLGANSPEKSRLCHACIVALSVPDP
ncbi:hypothetical protein K470DRAFT_264809 [Piedraia hortae CBS 480.64]|uniref:Cytoplasmic tRNA 2-thiolation protein 2 n=1 Tax=Piedraia hortae CBS 480.64 TaxID=1314780 RepID=A0A6A7BYB2_9PEZI|nr:hypothetical protein K470DRAFT_264809 [Piedraia hortae CBS 480.64]